MHAEHGEKTRSIPLQAWPDTLGQLQAELPAQQFNTWIRPLKELVQGSEFILQAPNRFIKDWVQDKYLRRIQELLSEHAAGALCNVSVVVGQSRQADLAVPGNKPIAPVRAAAGTQHEIFDTTNVRQGAQRPLAQQYSERASQPVHEGAYQGQGELPLTGRARPHELAPASTGEARSGANFSDTPRLIKPNTVPQVDGSLRHKHALLSNLNFQSFVVGKSNDMAVAAAQQVAANPGGSYNPLFLYGGVGLGKTHLMHAVGNALLEKNPNAKVVYLHSERFVADMVKALQLNAISDFKRYYRSVDALLIDDIQFFSGKDRSQEEFFHTFNALLEGGHQMIFTCDRYPKEIKGLEERLKSRFGWGLTAAIEPPELEIRVAILKAKADQAGVDLPDEAAFFIAQRICSNVRELEGALKRVIASAHFTSAPITVDLAREALKDLLALQERQVSLDNIKTTVASYYKIKIADLISKKRNRSIARPRQMAMALAKELTNHSLPEIGDAFGGRDHTTVLHACKRIKEMRQSSSDIGEDHKNLVRSLTT